MTSFPPTAGAPESALPLEGQVPSCPGPTLVTEATEILFLFILLKDGGGRQELGTLSKCKGGGWAGRFEEGV